jgi:hypothetical protein
MSHTIKKGWDDQPFTYFIDEIDFLLSAILTLMQQPAFGQQ